MTNKNNNKITLTADCVIVFGDKLLMIKRAIKPYKNHWVLPGGHVENGERVEETLKREVLEEVGINLDNEFEIIQVYSDPDRDPRGRTVSCAYFSKKEDINSIKLNKESDKFKFYSFDNLPDKIGFDHRQIIEDAYDKFLK